MSDGVTNERSGAAVIGILGGTAEAGELARRAGRFCQLVKARKASELPPVTALIDARHPFAKPAEAPSPGVPVLRLVRPPWRAGPDDHWTQVRDPREVAAHVPAGAVVFVATGRGWLDTLADLEGRVVWWRRRGAAPKAFPFARGGWSVGEGPFSVSEEAALFSRLGIEWLVVQNAGGSGAWPKLEAARVLRLKVAMIERPPVGSHVETVGEALDWARRAVSNPGPIE